MHASTQLFNAAAGVRCPFCGDEQQSPLGFQQHIACMHGRFTCTVEVSVLLAVQPPHPCHPYPHALQLPHAIRLQTSYEDVEACLHPAPDEFALHGPRR